MAVLRRFHKGSSCPHALAEEVSGIKLENAGLFIILCQANQIGRPTQAAYQTPLAGQPDDQVGMRHTSRTHRGCRVSAQWIAGARCSCEPVRVGGSRVTATRFTS